MPSKQGRFKPVHFLWMARELEKGRKRRDIIRDCNAKFGLTIRRTRTNLLENFPKDVPPQTALWRYREKAYTRVKRSEISRKAALKKSPEERSAISKRAQASLTPEQRRNRSRKGIATMGPERRRMRSLKGARSMSAEQRSENARKAHEAARKNMAREVAYVNELPVLNLLTQREKEEQYYSCSPILKKLMKKYKKYPDFPDIQGTAYLALADALAKWDRKRGLEELVKDSVEFNLIEYFGERGKWEWYHVPYGDIHRLDHALQRESGNKRTAASR